MLILTYRTDTMCLCTYTISHLTPSLLYHVTGCTVSSLYVWHNTRGRDGAIEWIVPWLTLRTKLVIFCTLYSTCTMVTSIIVTVCVTRKWWIMFALLHGTHKLLMSLWIPVWLLVILVIPYHLLWVTCFFKFWWNRRSLLCLLLVLAECLRLEIMANYSCIELHQKMW